MPRHDQLEGSTLARWGGAVAGLPQVRAYNGYSAASLRVDWPAAGSCVSPEVQSLVPPSREYVNCV